MLDKGSHNVKMTRNKTTIWIDLDNSPHVPFFRPIIEELEKRGYSTMITARDCFQVCGLADQYNITYKRIGRHWGKNKVKKGIGLMYRALQMAPAVMKVKPDLAISHGSRAQGILSSILKIPFLYIFDYEFTSEIPFVHPGWVLTPEVIPDEAIRAKHHQIQFLKYPGIKEDVYVPFFKPEPGIIRQLGINEDAIIVTIRPPATEAHYFNPRSEELFKGAINWLAGINGVRMVILPRNETQGRWIEKLMPAIFDSGKAVIPRSVVDGLNLIWHSDLVISGGGTMNREAAALGVPVYSIFRGAIGAVDKYLSGKGRLTLLETPQDFRTKVRVEKWQRPPMPEIHNRHALEAIVRMTLEVLETVQTNRRA